MLLIRQLFSQGPKSTRRLGVPSPSSAKPLTVEQATQVAGGSGKVKGCPQRNYGVSVITLRQPWPSDFAAPLAPSAARLAPSTARLAPWQPPSVFAQ